MSFRPLEPEQVAYWESLLLDRDCLAEHFLPDDLPRLRWTDDNSNFAGVFTGGLLCGWVFYLDHEETSSVPRFRDAATFEAFLLSCGEEDWHTVPADYPRSFSCRYDEEDRALALKCRDLWRTSGSQLAGFRFLTLLPLEGTSEAMEALESSNMWIQAAAAELLGERGYAGAVGRLFEVARSGTHNGRIAALLALGKLGAEGRRYLEILRPEMPEHRGYFPDHLR